MSDKFAAVEPHNDIEEILTDVFRVSGSVVFAPLMRLTRNMIIVREGSALTLVNAVRLNPETEAKLEALGTVKNVVKIGVHSMDDAYYIDRFGTTSWALPGVEHGASPRRLTSEDLPFACRLFVFEHTVEPEGALLLERDGGLLITCDSVQNWEHTEGCSAAAKVATKLMGFMRPAQIGPPWRKRMTPKGGSLKPDFDRMVELPFSHLIGGHGEPLNDKANELLRATITHTWP